MKANWLEGDRLADPINPETLGAEGVLYRELPLDPPGYQPTLDSLRNEAGYIEQDQVELAPDTPKLDEICAKFVDEHLHDDDEVRFVLEGAGVFDIRSSDDRWMRVEVDAGDLIVVPAGRYHRFFLTDAKHIRCVRLFKDSSGWVPRYREAS
jgi:1,2-dihydroxy-3-keto-5-methylthiopentene dioxygenase